MSRQTLHKQPVVISIYLILLLLAPQLNDKGADTPHVLFSPQINSPVSQNGSPESVISYRKTEPAKTDTYSERVYTEERAQTEEAEEENLEDLIKIHPKLRRAALLQSKLSKYYSNANILDIRSIINAQIVNTRHPGKTSERF